MRVSLSVSLPLVCFRLLRLLCFLLPLPLSLCALLFTSSPFLCLCVITPLSLDVPLEHRSLCPLTYCSQPSPPTHNGMQVALSKVVTNPPQTRRNLKFEPWCAWEEQASKQANGLWERWCSVILSWPSSFLLVNLALILFLPLTKE